MKQTHECPLCIVYRRIPATTDGTPCGPCRGRLRGNLDTIPVQYALLDASPTPNASERITGSAETQLGVRVPVLDLIGPANLGTVRDTYGDQVGHVSVATVLDGWVQDWAHERDQGERGPVPTVAALCAWLTDRLDWAHQHHPALEDFATDISQVAATLRATNGDVLAEPIHKAGIPCPGIECDRMTLHETTDYVECLTDKGGCGRLLSYPEYHQWVRIQDYHLQQDTPCPDCGVLSLHSSPRTNDITCSLPHGGCGAEISRRKYEKWATQHHRVQKVA